MMLNDMIQYFKDLLEELEIPESKATIITVAMRATVEPWIPTNEGGTMTSTQPEAAEPTLERPAMGTRVKDKYTGFVGTVTARVEYLDEAPACRVEARDLSRDGKPVSQWIADSRLEGEEGPY